MLLLGDCALLETQNNSRNIIPVFLLPAVLVLGSYWARFSADLLCVTSGCSIFNIFGQYSARTRVSVAFLAVCPPRLTSVSPRGHGTKETMAIIFWLAIILVVSAGKKYVSYRYSSTRKQGLRKKYTAKNLCISWRQHRIRYRYTLSVF
ncbi:hypothetical protein HOY80DRAFT_75363 [Tuber brumale]|nr:hypothetical protein HOY80DRAFT_75363 [Tuber brumale]